MKREGQFKAATREFERAAKRYGLKIERGPWFGEIRNIDARFAWFFWYSGWQRRHSWNKRRASDKGTPQP